MIKSQKGAEGKQGNNLITVENYIKRRKASKRNSGKGDIIEAVRLACILCKAVCDVHHSGDISSDFIKKNIVVELNDADIDSFVSVKNTDVGACRTAKHPENNSIERSSMKGKTFIKKNIVVELNNDDIDSFVSVKNTDVGACHTAKHPENSLIERSSMKGKTYNGKQESPPSTLFSLGITLYELFASLSPFSAGGQKDVIDNFSTTVVEITEQHKSGNQREKLAVKTPFTPLRELGTPVSLCNLVSSLLQTNATSHRYGSPVEVEQELHQMLMQPDRFLFDSNVDVKEGDLKISQDQLYGRKEQISMLMDTYHRVNGTSEAIEMVLVSGYSGTGKSSLVQCIRQPVTTMGGIFLSGKFNQLGHVSRPFDAIATAFNEYCDIVMGKYSEESIDQLRKTICDAIGSEKNVMSYLIPNLQKIIGDTATAPLKLGSCESLNTLHYCFRMFARAISSPSHPVVLFLDDLQWADSASLDLIQTLVSDSENISLLFVGCYRDNEGNQEDPLSTMIGDIEKAGIGITKINVSNIDKESINKLISDSLRLTLHLTRPLANVVYRKTDGNPLFVIQFLKSLCDNGLLHFSLRSRRWEWDVKYIESKNVANNVAELMVSKMLKLSKRVQNVLKVAACLGFQFDSSTAEVLHADIEERMIFFSGVNIAVDEGIMDKIGTKYKFAHDQIAYTAYSLIPESQREVTHIRIGRLIWSNASISERENLIFLSADQMNRGLRLITDHDEKVKVVKLNLMAGERAMAASAFLLASKYAKLGISIINELCWKRNYELCLALFNLGAEAQYVIAEIHLMVKTLKEIFTHARTFKHKVHAHYTFVKSMGSRGLLTEAIHAGLNVLTKFGEKFPDNVNKPAVLVDFGITQDMLDGFTEDAILSLNLMVEENKLSAMKFFNLMMMYTTVAGKQDLTALIGFKMVRLSLSCGLCRESACGFSLYGIILCGPFGNVKKAYHFGKLAVKILNRFNARDCLARVYAVVYGIINPWSQPLQSCLDPHLYAQKTGMLTGDVEYAMLNLHFYLAASFQSGKMLKELSNEMRIACFKMAKYNQGLVLSFALTFWQATLNLMGLSDDPIKLSGDAMDRDKLLKNARDRTNSQCEFLINYHSMCLAYYFGEYDLAAELAGKYRYDPAIVSGRFIRCDYTFCDGLICLSLGRKTKNKKWRVLAVEMLKQMREWAENSPWNCQQKLKLLNAELFFLDGYIHKAAKAYDDAISIAHDHRFINDEGLACERAGVFHHECGNLDAALNYFTRSHECYIKWGAQGKADHLSAKWLAN